MWSTTAGNAACYLRRGIIADGRWFICILRYREEAGCRLLRAGDAMCFQGFAWTSRDPFLAAILLLESDTPDALILFGSELVAHNVTSIGFRVLQAVGKIVCHYFTFYMILLC